MTRVLRAAALGALLLLALDPIALAQGQSPQYVSAASTDCTTASSCAIFEPGSASTMAFTIAGTFSATLIFEATTDGVTWAAVQATNVTDGTAATAGASGTFAVANVGFIKIRVRASAWVSGTVRVSATRGYASSARLGGGGSGASYSNLVQSDPNTLQIRNGTTAQEFSIFKSYTDANNFQHLRFWWDPAQDLGLGGAVGGWSMTDRSVVAGTPSTNYGYIRLAAKAIELRDNNNAIRFSVSNAGVHAHSNPIYYDTVDTNYRVTSARAIAGKDCWTSAGSRGDQNPLDACMSRFEPGVIGFFNQSGATETTGGNGTVMIGDAGTKPTCQASRRGMFWHDFGGAGAKDTVEICAKDAGDLYAWRTIY